MEPRDKQPRDTRPVLSLFFPHTPPAAPRVKKSYYHSPADQDYLYKASALAKPILTTSVAIGLYDAYQHQGFRKFVPLLAHSTIYLFPAFTAGSLFVAANAIAVKINGKDTPWCHFWGPVTSVAFLAHWFKLGACHHVAIVLGLVGVRYRYSRVREMETGIPMFPMEAGKFSQRQAPSYISHMLRMEPIYKMPPEVSEL